jgi:hypothetical protein
LEHPLHRYWDPVEKPNIIGRKIYYREIPSIITKIFADQACILARREDGLRYPAPVYEEDKDETEEQVKLDILSNSAIWWYRD